MDVRRTATGTPPAPARRTDAPPARGPGEPDTSELTPARNRPVSGTARPSAAMPSRPAAPPEPPARRPGPPPPQPAASTDRTGSGARPAPTRPGPRRARLLVTRLDPWSVMKTFFMLSVAVAIVLVVATALLWWTLDVTGVFDAVDRTVDDVVGTGSTPFDFMAVVGFQRVMGAVLVLSAIEIVLVSAMATLFAFLYNLTVGFTHGLEVTLTEDN